MEFTQDLEGGNDTGKDIDDDELGCDLDESNFVPKIDMAKRNSMKAGFHRKSVNTANFNEGKEIQDNDLSQKMSADLKTSLERDKLKWCCCCIPVKCGVHLIGLLVILALF